jgi:hypothetical protein
MSTGSTEVCASDKEVFGSGKRLCIIMPMHYWLGRVHIYETNTVRTQAIIVLCNWVFLLRFHFG